MAENELSIAAFYYQFFNDQKNEGMKKEPQEQIKDNPESSRDFWVEDVWTEDDEANAQELLASNLEKCSVSTLDHRNEDDEKAWNRFYRDHGDRFFKDRHYLTKAFPKEFSPNGTDDCAKKTLVEIGCGVGNALLPLLEDLESPWKVIHGLDISGEAVDILKKDSRFIEFNKQDDRSVYGHVCDISTSLPPSCFQIADVATLLFCLSAIDPLAMQQAANHVASALKPGGVLVLRDYGRYDEAQMKLGLSRNKLLKDNFYRKHDGTKCFYFRLEDVEKLFTQSGLEVLELKFLRRMYRNNASQETRRRVWVQGRFRKPDNIP